MIHANAPPEVAFIHIRSIGGKRGWYYATWLWRMRGLLDRLAGGVGNRGRRHPEELVVGDTIDFWRVEELEPGKRLRLALELRQPGRGWLDLEVMPNGSGSNISLAATYDPGGLLGKAYWYAVYPFHDLVFKGILRGIAERSVHSAASVQTSSA